MRARSMLAGSIVLLMMAAGETLAQRPSSGSSAGSPTLEARADLLAARHPTFQLGVAALWPVSPYLSVGGVAGAGVTDGVVTSGERSASGRAEIVARFTPDPSPDSRWRFHGQATAGVLVVHGASGRALVGLAMGVERATRGGVTPAFELGLGGGLRVAVALRRTGRR